MKKTILLLAVIFTGAIMLTSCKETKKETKTDVKVESHDNHEGHDHAKEEMASGDVYQCPMDCEKGKTYDKEGSCPVCKMDLKVNSKEQKEMEHAENCKCKEAGECTCEDGKCECKAEVATNAMDCTHCEPGSCECKA